MPSSTVVISSVLGLFGVVQTAEGESQSRYILLIVRVRVGIPTEADNSLDLKTRPEDSG